MNNGTPIDWSKVVVGETWLESPKGSLCRVDGVQGGDVWVYYKEQINGPAYHFSWTKSSIASCKWKIREAWEDITHQCYMEWDRFYGESRDVPSIFYETNNQVHRVNSKTGYKLEGMKVYKRRQM